MWQNSEQKPIEQVLISIHQLRNRFNSLIDIRGLREKLLETRQKIEEGAKGLTFVESTHSYFYNNTQLIPVSDVIKFFIPQTDFVKVSKNYAIKNGKTAEFWKNSWELKAKIATTSGSFSHLFAETIGRIIWNESDLDSSIITSCKCDDYLMPLYPKQEAVIRFFNDLYINKEIPVAVENKMLFPQFGISGTFDLLTYSIEEQSFMIRDYKTNATLTKDFKKSMLPPFGGYNVEPLSDYIIQQNLYSLMLRQLGILIAERSLIWLKDTGYYEKVDLSNQEKLVLKAIKKLMED